MKLMEAIRTVDARERMNIVHVQSVFLQEDVIALKGKARVSNIKDAVSKAVYHYLECKKTDEDDE